MYAKFDDSDGRENEPAASGSVKLESNNSEQLPSFTITQTPCPKSSTSGNNCKVLSVVLGVFLVTLAAFTIANFCLVMQIKTTSYSTTAIKNVLSALSKTSKARLRGNCQLLYNKNCFYVTWMENIEYIDGENICKNNDGFPGNIHDIQHFNIIRGILKQTKVGAGKTIWIGMKYNVTSGAVYFTDGSKVGYQLKWSGIEYPKKNLGEDRLGIRHHFDTKYDGFINYSPLQKMDGVLCEINDNVV